MEYKIVFVVDNLSIPRCIKRINAFVEAGFQVKVYGYDRGKNLNNQLPQEIQPTILGIMADGKGYFSRLSTIRKDIKRVVDENKDKNTVFYSFGFVASLFFSLSKVPYIYEISDIRYGSYKRLSPLIGLFKVIDKRTVKKSLATVMTSGGFKEFLGVDKKDVFLIPNKINPVLANFDRTKVEIKSEQIRFAFVGSVRYHSVIRFAEVIGKSYPQHHFSFYGSGPKETKEVCETLTRKYVNIDFNGPFRNPEDLSSIYANIDVVISSYDVNTLNERIAEPNKLYESIFFCRPIVVSKDTYLSRQVENYQCGFSIDASTEETIKEFIDRISKGKIEEYSKSEYNIPVNELIDSTGQIIEFIRNVKL